jgi:hypothetical protein
VTLLLTACTARQERRWAERDRRMTECRNGWTYLQQKEHAAIRVIYFQSTFPFDEVTYPNFIIGITTEGDTIGAVDRLLPSGTAIGDTIGFGPAPWMDEEILSTRPAYQVFDDKRLNALYCAVRTIHYGRIDTLVP